MFDPQRGEIRRWRVRKRITRNAFSQIHTLATKMPHVARESAPLTSVAQTVTKHTKWTHAKCPKFYALKTKPRGGGGHKADVCRIPGEFRKPENARTGQRNTEIQKIQNTERAEMQKCKTYFKCAIVYFCTFCIFWHFKCIFCIFVFRILVFSAFREFAENWEIRNPSSSSSPVVWF